MALEAQDPELARIERLARDRSDVKANASRIAESHDRMIAIDKRIDTIAATLEKQLTPPPHPALVSGLSAIEASLAVTLQRVEGLEQRPQVSIQGLAKEDHAHPLPPHDHVHTHQPATRVESGFMTTAHTAQVENIETQLADYIEAVDDMDERLSKVEGMVNEIWQATVKKE